MGEVSGGGADIEHGKYVIDDCRMPMLCHMKTTAARNPWDPFSDRLVPANGILCEGGGGQPTNLPRYQSVCRSQGRGQVTLLYSCSGPTLQANSDWYVICAFLDWLMPWAWASNAGRHVDMGVVCMTAEG